MIYNYSLKPLDEWFCEHTRSPEKYLSGRGVFGFDYNNYMKGLISDNGFCQRLCETFDVDLYETVRRRLGCKFEEMIFVDDKERNVRAAADLGICGVVFWAETIEKDLQKILAETGSLLQPTKSKARDR